MLLEWSLSDGSICFLKLAAFLGGRIVGKPYKSTYNIIHSNSIILYRIHGSIDLYTVTRASYVYNKHI